MTTNENRLAYTVFRYRLVTACIAIMILLAIGQSWKIKSDYDATVNSTITQTNNLVLAIEAHVVDTIDSIDTPLKEVSRAVATAKMSGKNSPADIKHVLTSPFLPLNANYWVIFIDASGHGVASSNDLQVNGVAYGDREYFKIHKNQANVPLFVGEPNIGRVSKKMNYYISKRVENNQHEFLGVIVACVDSLSLANFLQGSLYEKSLSITTLNTKGQIIARVPRYKESFGLDISKSDLFKNVPKAKNGNYRAESVVDRDARIYAYRSLATAPLIVTVGMKSPAFLDILKKDALETIAGMSFLLLVLKLFSRFALNSFKNIEQYAQNQRVLNQQIDTAKSEVEAAERRARMIADNMPALVAYVDAAQRYQFRNSYYSQIPGVEYETMIGKTMQDVFGPSMHAAIENEVAAALSGKAVVFERDVPGRDGRILCLRYQYSPDIKENGLVAGFYTLVTDVTDMKTVQNQLLALARIDSLTGLPNRTALYERIAEAVARNARRNHKNNGGDKIACLFLDIDKFKEINDTYGHACGDNVLIEFSARVKKCIRQSDMLARLAGDEFIVLLEGLDQPSGAETVASKIINAMTVPFSTETGVIKVTTSIGIALSDKKDENADQLLKKADTALYQAKHNGRNNFVV